MSPDATPQTSDFRVATSVERDAHVPGRYHADIPTGWNSPVGVHGGVLVATIVRAMVAAHGAETGMSLRTVHASFLERPASGSLVVDTEVVRVGGLTAHVEANARAHGQDETAARVWGLFARPRGRVARPYLDAAPPEVPAPDQLPPESFGMPGRLTPALFENLEFKAAIGHLPWSQGWVPDQPARYARWNRYLVPPIVGDGAIDPLSLLTVADLPAAAFWVRSVPGDPFLAAVSLEMTVHFLESPEDEWLLADFRARWFDDGYVFTEADLWSAGRLVAVSTQVMLVRELT